MSKKEIIDIDTEFEGIEFDEAEIKKDTSNKKRSESLIGKKRGTVHDSESLDKIKNASIGRIHSEETRAKISNYHKGKVMSVETRAKISIARKGKKQSNETVAKRSNSMKNKNNKIIVTPAGIFLSRKFAAEYYGIRSATINYRIKTDPEQYYYITHEEYKQLTSKEL